MKYLILINGAPNYRPTYVEIGNNLLQMGHEVVYAMDSKVTNYIFPNNKINQKIYYFTDFFKKNYSNTYISAEYLDCNLWGMFYSDFERFSIYDLHNKKDKVYFKSCIINLVNFFDDILKKEQYDAIIYENISNSFSYAGFIVTDIHQKEYYGISSTRLPNRFEIQKNPEGNAKQIYQTYNGIENNSIQVPDEIISSTDHYLKNFMVTIPDYMKNNALDTNVSLVSKYLNKNKIDLLSSYIKYTFNESKELYYAYQIDNPIRLLGSFGMRNIKRKIKLKFITKYYSCQKEGEEFFLYPLHYHPESSTSVLAKNYVDELVLIENISKNLPFGNILYVKDHMSAAGYPSLDFYKKLYSLPNVKLIHYAENTKNMIKKAKAIITVTSTVGYEALLLKKKVFLFGDVFYSNHPNCVKVDNLDKLFALLLDTKVNINTDKINLNFLYAYFLNTYPTKVEYTKNANIELAKQFTNLITDISR